MGAGGGLVAGSGKEFVVINAEDSWRAKPLRVLGGGICQICGEHIEILEFNNIKEFFVACNECAFPVCRACYEYERREGDQLCPRCKTRYKRQRGSPRVDGDDEEDEADDLDHEFSFCNANWNIVSGSKFGIHGNNGACSSELHHSNSKISADFPRLTYGEAHAHDQHTLIVPLSMKSRDSTDKVVFPAELCTPFQPRPMNQSGDISLYGYGSIAWKNGVENWNRRRLKFEEEDKDFDECDADALIRDEARQPLSRKLPIASKKINPYRLVIILRLIAIAFFFHYRLLNPVPNAYALWLASVICEASFAISWMLEQLPKWHPIERETFLDRLSLRYEKEEEERSQLADVDVFINTVDPKKEHPLATANAVLSVLAVDYPADKVSCYVSDDGAAMLTFEALSETAVYAKRWVPFCKRFNIEPRAPEWYFYQKMDYLKGKIDPAFVGERRAMKREYEEFKVRINGLVSMSQKVPEEGWTMQHGAPWPGNNAQDHPGMVQVFLGHGDSLDANGDNLPRLVYVSREKRPGFNHHKRAGAMNALMRVSGVLSNAPFILNLDCRHYINNSKVLREAMCFMMDPTSGRKVCFVQFPYKIDGDNRIDNFSDRVVFFNINMKGLDGIQGPIYLGTGCVFRRQALYGIEAPMKEKHTRNTRNCWRKWCFLCNLGRRSRRTRPKNEENNKFLKQNGEISTQVHSLETILEEVAGKDLELISLAPFDKLEKKFGRSPAVVASTLTENSRISIAKRSASALEEALHVISCGYEDKTAWGKEVGWIYGSVADDVLTSFKMHCHGWQSVYCMPRRIAFKGAAPTDISDYLHLVLRWAQGSVEIFLSKHCPIWYGYGSGMKCLQRLSYISLIICPWTALPFITYCSLPAFCLLTGKFFIAEVTIYLSIILLALFTSIIATSILEMNWGDLALADWWQNEQFWAISATSSYLFALFHGAVEIFTGIKAELFLTHTGQQNEESRRRKWSILLIPPTALVMLNVIGLVSGISNAVNGNYDSWGALFGKILFAVWVVVHLCPSLKGIVMRERKRWVPTIVVVWSILVASVCSLLWVRLDPFVGKSEGPVLEVCGLDCD